MLPTDVDAIRMRVAPGPSEHRDGRVGSENRRALPKMTIIPDLVAEACRGLSGKVGQSCAWR